jgi:carbon storage regulator CsrA
MEQHERPEHKAGLLILRRRVGQKIVIGKGPNKITVMVTGIGEHRVALGVNAPWDVPVNREEVYEQLYPFGDEADVLLESPLENS